MFYVTSRDQGDKTFDYAMDHLRIAKLPNVDNKHVTVLRDTSNKQNRQDEIAKTHDIVVFLGDSLNDFRRKVLHQGRRRAHQPDGIGSQRVWPPLYRVPEPDRRALDARDLRRQRTSAHRRQPRETFKKVATRAARRVSQHDSPGTDSAKLPVPDTDESHR